MGPLTGLQVVELDAIGPVPFCAMLLADLGADVVHVDRVGGGTDPLRTINLRNRSSVAVDIRTREGSDIVLRLAEMADVLLEGMRPGVAERLGIGPKTVRDRNPRLVYGRMTGWGQDGPLATTAGHDIDYIAVAGALHAIGGAEPVPPLNLVGDFGGGALYLAMGVLAALYERESSGLGQVVDAAMVDGVASLMSMTYAMRGLGMWSDRRADNLLDGSAPFYRTFRTADDRHVAVGALEPQFFAALLDVLGIDPADIGPQMDRAGWPAMAERFAAVFLTRDRDDWELAFEGIDACVAPVLSLDETPHHPHMTERGTFVEVGGSVVPGPAPRFDRTPPALPTGAPAVGEHTSQTLTRIGLDPEEIAGLRTRGIVA